MRIVALGDSLVAGYGLNVGEDFASQLQKQLQNNGVSARVDNAGISGDTSAMGLARLEQAIAGEPAPKLVIVVLGANDFLRQVNPATTKQNLESILERLQSRKIPVLMAGMRCPPQCGAVYKTAFDNIYPELAEKFNVPLYPFFLEGVALSPALNLPDRAHPNAKGVELMAKSLAPMVREALEEN